MTGSPEGRGATCPERADAPRPFLSAVTFIPPTRRFLGVDVVRDARADEDTPAGAPQPSSPVRRSGRSPAATIRRNRTRRALIAITAVLAAEVVGTVGFHVIEGAGWINAFYFESMLATGQGPPFTLVTNTGKIFASIMAFVSVGSTLSAVIFAVGPLLSRVWRELVEDVEVRTKVVEQDIEAEFREIERELR